MTVKRNDLTVVRGIPYRWLFMDMYSTNYAFARGGDAQASVHMMMSEPSTLVLLVDGVIQMP